MTEHSYSKMITSYETKEFKQLYKVKPVTVLLPTLHLYLQLFITVIYYREETANTEMQTLVLW